MRTVALLREALAAARSQPVATVLTIAMVAGMCVAALLTTGRTVAAEQAALAHIDAAGTRSVIVRADPSAGLTVAVLDRLRTVAGIEALAGFGPIVDGRNAAVPGAPKVAVRTYYDPRGDFPVMSGSDAFPEERAVASPAATRALGLRDGTGAVLLDDGRVIVVAGQVDVPAHLKFLDPLVLIGSPIEGDRSAPLALLVVLARSPGEVAAVEQAVLGLLGPVDREGVTVETSAELAAIRAAVSGELGGYGRGTVLVILAVAALLVAVNLLGLVTMRRKDFGRRRALGASQALIVGLVLAQVTLLAAAGAGVGTGVCLLGLLVAGEPIPGVAFTAAVAVAAVLTAALAAVVPAVIAARRDPLHELRVP